MCKAMLKVTWKVVKVVINGILIIGLTVTSPLWVVPAFLYIYKQLSDR
jgi:hypothetical protein